MKVDQNFICFGCHEKGDVINFVSKLFGLQPHEAAVKIINDMGLPVTVEGGQEPQTSSRTGWAREQRRMMEEKQFDQAVLRAYLVYCDYFRLLNRWADIYAPRFPTEDYHPLFVEALQNREYVEYLLDLLLFGSKEDKASVLIDKGREVVKLEQRIRKFDPGDGECASGSGGIPAAGYDCGRSEGAAGNNP